jgi:glucokinase
VADTPRSEGRPACAVGLDVGGTKIAGGLVRFPAGVVTDRQVRPTRPERGPEAVFQDVADLAAGLARGAAFAGLPLIGVGIGVPELVDPEGRVTSGHCIDWQGWPLPERLAALGAVRVEADVRAAALAEALFGAGRPYHVFAYVTVGTGISSTLVQGGRPYAGARGNALVLGSSPLSSVCPQCGAEFHPVLEEIASGPALARRYNQRRAAAARGGEEVLEAAAAGDHEAIGAVRSAARALGTSVGFLVNVLDPEAVVVGGGLGLAGGLYWDELVASTRRHIWAPHTRDLPVLPAALGGDAGITGAAAALWQGQTGAAGPG